MTAPNTRTPSARRPRRWRRRLFRWLFLRPLLILTLLVLAAHALFETERGRAILEYEVNRQLRSDDLTVRIEGLSGLPWDPRADRLTVADAEGVWLDAADIRLEWAVRPRAREIALLAGSAERVRIDRPPSVPDRPPREPAEPFRTAWTVGLHQLRIGRLELGPDLGIPEGLGPLGVRGHAGFEDGRWFGGVAVSRTEAPGDEIRATAEVRSDQVRVHADGEVDLAWLADGLPRARLRLRGQGPPEAWRAEVHLDGEGWGRAELGADFAMDGEQIRVRIEGEARSPWFETWAIGSPVRMGLDARSEAPWRRVELEGLSLSARAGEMTASGWIEPAAASTALRAHLALPCLETAWLGTGLPPDIDPRDLRIDAELAGSWPAGLHGFVAARAETDLGPWFALTALEAAADTWAVSDLLARGPGISLRAYAVHGEEPLQAEARIDIPDLAALAPWHGREDVAGSASLTVGGGRAEGQPLRIHAGLTDLAVAGFALTSADVLARVDDWTEAPEIEARLRTREARWGERPVPDLAGHLSGTPARIDWDLAARPPPGWPEASAGGAVSRDDAGWAGELNRLHLAWNGIEGDLAEPSVWTWHDGRLEIPPWEWMADTMRIRGETTLEEGRVDARVRLDGFPVALLPPGIAERARGDLSGRVIVAGPLASPAVAWQADLTRLEFATPILAGLDPFHVRTEGTFHPDRVSTSLAVEHADLGHVAVRVAGPWPEEGLGPWLDRLWELPGEAGLDVDLRLAALNELPALAGQDLRGRVFGRVIRRQRPGAEAADWEGGLDVVGLGYEAYGIGALLRDGRGRLEASDQKLDLRELVLRDGGDGRVALSGSVGLRPLFPFEATATATGFEVIRRPDAQARLSGRLGLTGDLDGAEVEGRLEVRDVLVDIAQIPPSPPPVIADYRAEPEPDVPEEEDEGVGPWLRGRIRLDIPGPVHVRGPGLDIEADGGLDLVQEGAGWSVTGQAQARRGSFLFFSRLFRIESAVLRFDGVVPPDPLLEVEARYSRADLDATLRVTGRLDRLTMALSSDPALPEDEILSRILFGRGVAGLTALQAVQLGLAARSMAGEDAALGFMERTRVLLRVDQLEIREAGAEASEPELVAGKQVSDRVYLQVHQGLSAEGTGRLTLEYEIHRNLTAETSAAPNLRPGFGLNWRLDFGTLKPRGR